MLKPQDSQMTFGRAAVYGLLAVAVSSAAGLLLMAVCITAGGPETRRLLEGTRSEPPALRMAVSVLLSLWAAGCSGRSKGLLRQRPRVSGPVSALFAGSAGAIVALAFILAVEPRPGAFYNDAGTIASLWASAALLGAPIVAGALAGTLAGRH